MVASANPYLACVRPSGLLTVKLNKASVSSNPVAVYNSSGQNINEVVALVSDRNHTLRSNENLNAATFHRGVDGGKADIEL